MESLSISSPGIMRVVLVGLLLLPLIASSQPRRQQIQSGSLTISAITPESIEPVGVADAEVLLRGISAGQTNSQGGIFLRGFETSPSTPISSLPPGVLEGVPLLPGPIRDADLYAAYAPPTETDGGTVVLLDSPDELTFMIGNRPHAMLNVPVDWRCSGIDLTYDSSANTLDAEPSGCSEPAILEISCPVSLQSDDTGVFEVRLSGRYDLPVEWSVRDASGVDLNVDYSSEDMGDGAMVARINGAWESFNRAMAEEREATVTASLGDTEEECRVDIEALSRLARARIPDDESGPSARILIGYNVEFGSISTKVGGSAPIPIGVPLYGDVSAGYFSDGGVGYGLLQAELQCSTELTPLMMLFWGGGLHLLRQSSNGNTNLEAGPGVSGRIEYQFGGWQVKPTAEVSASYHYDTVIPTLSVGATYRFSR